MSLTETQIEAFRAFFSDTVVLSVVGGTLLLFTLAFCRIFARAGHRAALGFLMLIPGVNVIMVLLLAFGRWPVEQEMRGLRKVQKRADQARDALSKAA